MNLACRIIRLYHWLKNSLQNVLTPHNKHYRPKKGPIKASCACVIPVYSVSIPRSQIAVISPGARKNENILTLSFMVVVVLASSRSFGLKKDASRINLELLHIPLFFVFFNLLIP